MTMTIPKRKPKILTRLRIDEISSVDRGAGEGVKIMLMKRHNPEQRPTFDVFDDVHFSKATLAPPAIDPDDPDDDDDVVSSASAISDKFEQFISLLIEANPALDRQGAVYFLIHNAHGRALAAHLASVTKTKEPKMLKMDKLTKYIGESPGNMSAVAKHIIEKGETSLTEHEFTAMLTEHAKLNKRAGESVMGCFARIFEHDAEIRRAHAITKAGPNTMSVDPVQVGGNDAFDTSVADSSAKAMKQLQTMAEAQRQRAPTLTIAQAFARVFEDPANAELAAKAHRRPTPTTAYAFPT